MMKYIIKIEYIIVNIIIQYIILMDTHNTRYIINIYERYSDLKNSNKTEFDNNDLWKIFEYYCCIK